MRQVCAGGRGGNALNIVIGLLVLGVIVCFHELGHFAAARIFGVKVESFSIGMGPVLLHKTFRGTDYRLSLFPIGGYCGMKGEKDFAKAVEEKLPHIQGEKDSLYGIHPMKRAAIAFAGPFFNLIMACAAYTVIAMTGYTYYTRSATIEIPEYAAFVSPAREAGIISGDTITSINGIKVSDFSDIAEEISSRPDEDVVVEVRRGNETLTFTVRTILNKKTGAGMLGVKSSGEIISKEMPRYAFFPAIGQGVLQTGKMISLTIKSIGVLFKGVDVTNAVSGPARISSILGERTHEGFSQDFKTGLVTLCQFIALISVSLFIMNLLPIPVLDGGMILFALIQAATKRQIPPKIQYGIQIAGVLVIAALFMLGLSGDIRYFAARAKG